MLKKPLLAAIISALIRGLFPTQIYSVHPVKPEENHQTQAGRTPGDVYVFGCDSTSDGKIASSLEQEGYDIGSVHRK